MTTFVGQNLGAGDHARAKQGTRTALLLSEAVTVVVLLPLMLLSPQLISLFNQEPEVLRYGTLFIRFISPFYLVICINQIISGSLRGAGDSLIPTIMTLTGVCLLRVFWVTVVVSAHHELNVLLLSYPITWSVTSGMFLIYYLRGRWLKRCIALQNAGN